MQHKQQRRKGKSNTHTCAQAKQIKLFKQCRCKAKCFMIWNDQVVSINTHTVISYKTERFTHADNNHMLQLCTTNNAQRHIKGLWNMEPKNKTTQAPHSASTTDIVIQYAKNHHVYNCLHSRFMGLMFTQETRLSGLDL